VDLAVIIIHPQEEMSQIWLQLRQESRKKKLESCFVLATSFRKVLSKYGDFRPLFPQNKAIVVHYFIFLNFVSETCGDFIRICHLIDDFSIFPSIDKSVLPR
jgi:hypothetical protein